MDSVARAHFDALDGNLSSPHRTVRPQTTLRDYVDARARTGPSQTSRRGNCRRKISRSPSWNTVGRKRSVGHRGNSYDVWSRALSPPRPRARRGCSETAERRWSGVDCQTELGRAGTERYVVRRTDDESLAAGGGFVGLQRRAGRGHRGGTG